VVKLKSEAIDVLAALDSKEKVFVHDLFSSYVIYLSCKIWHVCKRGYNMTKVQ
jgi:hypothetical protein